MCCLELGVYRERFFDLVFGRVLAPESSKSARTDDADDRRQRIELLRPLDFTQGRLELSNG